MNVEEYERMFLAEERQWWYAGMREITDALLSGAGGVAAGRILDAGCGTGNNLLHLGRRGAAVGVDLSEEALRYCRGRGVRAVGGSLLRLPFRDGVFDCVTSFDVLYHRWITDDGVAMAEMARVLRPGGLLLVRVPALKVLWGAHDEAVHSRHRYSRSEVKALLRRAGLEILRSTYANFFLFPLLATRRTFDRLSGRQGSDVQFLSPALERTFLGLLRLEARLVRHVTLPIGASVFGLARKP
ncbi:MAG: methyltransferase domain-containing protein [Vicinamibacteria bacterium]